MYENLRGKKLLVIGSEELDACIVRTAQSLGVYVIAVDGKPKSASTFAKNEADESWDMDYSDTEAVSRRCLESGVDGVIAGYSEHRVLAACKIANAIGTPFYATQQQIELTRNKRRFKDECAKYGVLVPRDYCFNDAPTEEQLAAMEYPVIVKPTDYGGRKGITVCYDRETLDAAIPYAMKLSGSHTIIVEDYITGIEFAAVYSLSAGQISLSCFNEKYLNEQQTRKSGLCDLALTPSALLDDYLQQTDGSVKDFLRGIGARDGVAFFQGIADGERFWIFEMGYRLNGGNDYFLVEQCNGISYMKMLISHALTGSMGDDLSKDNPHLTTYHSNFPLYAHAGTVATVAYTGEENYPGVHEVHINKVPGDRIVEDGSTGQRAFSFKLSANSLDELARLINYVQSHVVLTDAEGNNLMFAPFDTGRLSR